MVRARPEVRRQTAGGERQAARGELRGGRPVLVRRKAIHQLVQERGFLSVAEMADAFSVSEMTIRRDLRQLGREGVIERSHGGAVSIETAGQGAVPFEPSFASRQRVGADAKAGIAAIAAGLVGDRDVIGLDVGSTVTRLAAELRSRGDLSVVTNNLQVLGELGAAEPGPEIYVLGGHYRRREGSLCGAATLHELKNFWLNKVFIGVAGITEEGVFDYSVEEAEIKKLFMDRASEVVVLCDSLKFKRRSLVRVGGLERIDILVAERAPPEDLAHALEREGVRILVPGAGDEGRASSATPPRH